MAHTAHAGQKYGGGPYVFHLYDAALALAEFGFSPHLAETTVEFDAFSNLTVAAFLHDIIEDTDWTYRDVRKEFGDDIADIVWAVTDEPGRNRKEKHAKTYPKIRADWRAMALKIADRIANTRNCASENPGLFRMYAKEWPEFQEAFKEASLAAPWNKVGFKRMWKHLEYLMESATKEGSE